MKTHNTTTGTKGTESATCITTGLIAAVISQGKLVFVKEFRPFCKIIL
jgi:hypothetical protein